MDADFEKLTLWIASLARHIEEDKDLDPESFIDFIYHSELALSLIDILSAIDEATLDDNMSYYSACMLALDICVAQLQSALESGSKAVNKLLERLMDYIAKAIDAKQHSLHFWLPVLTAFYDVKTELSPALMDAYFNLSCQEEESSEEEPSDNISAIKAMIKELSSFSVFDIAENFFAQSYAMPPDFFIDLISDLYSVKEGQDIALLSLLHPKPEVRMIALTTHEQLMPHIQLSSLSLSRLQMMLPWYPTAHQGLLHKWIKIQRKKGLIFAKSPPLAIMHIKATQIDAIGSQGLIIKLKQGNQYRVGGILCHHQQGIKDVWVSRSLSTKEIKKYYQENIENAITLKQVDIHYLVLIVNHFLALAQEKNSIPNLHLLEIQEYLGLSLQAETIDVAALIDKIAIDITPFTLDSLASALKRTKQWLNTKNYTSSWSIENEQIDKVVNYCSHFVKDIKICRVEEATQEVLQLLEQNRDKWIFHFLWVSLWLKVSARKNEKAWEDSFFIAYAIKSNMPLKDIPIMEDIARESVFNSMETMQERKTYLNKA